VEAARTISQRGVLLVATAHGTDLGSLLRNAELNSLIGGLQASAL
jgi:stage III sporulation protein SpoIIIAA